MIWVGLRSCGCLVTWFWYQMIAKPGNKTATPPWPPHMQKEPSSYGILWKQQIIASSTDSYQMSYIHNGNSHTYKMHVEMFSSIPPHFCTTAQQNIVKIHWVLQRTCDRALSRHFLLRVDIFCWGGFLIKKNVVLPVYTYLPFGISLHATVCFAMIFICAGKVHFTTTKQ